MTARNRRQFLQGLGGGLAGLCLPCRAQGSELAGNKRPNILLFVTDDESWLERSTDRYAYIMRYDNDEDRTDGRPLEPSAIERYDLENDPWQKVDLSTKAEYRDIKEKLSRQLIHFGQQTGDPRMAGDMQTFRQTRLFVPEHERGGYKE